MSKHVECDRTIVRYLTSPRTGEPLPVELVRWVVHDPETGTQEVRRKFVKLAINHFPWWEIEGFVLAMQQEGFSVYDAEDSELSPVLHQDSITPGF